jgi:hypothetical protein
MRLPLALVLVVGCGVDRNIESEISITHGVYGQLVEECADVGCQARPSVGTTVSAYGPLGSSQVLSANDSNRDGVYQLAVTGDVWLCTPADCTTAMVHVPASALVRYDWSSASGGQWIHSTTP